MESGNTYYVCLGDKVIPWNPHDSSQKINLHTDYFGKAFIALEQELHEVGWTIYLTWDVQKLPSYGPRVIAVVLGDERALIPRYEYKVAYIFKCYGVGPYLGCNPLKKPGYQNYLTVLQYIFALMQYLPGWLSRLRNHGESRNGSLEKASTHPIPLGYANQVEVPFKSLEDRTYDVSFAGSIVHKPYKWWSLQKWFKTPKSYSRSKMFSALQKIINNHPEWKIGLKITTSYGAIRQADPVQYSERVMNTKISLVPRGASYETFRFFESLRFGSIIVAEYLPPFWFYEGAPMVSVSNWDDLDSTIARLLDDPSKLEYLHQKTLDWWEDMCSERALGSYMASVINGESPRKRLKKDKKRPKSVQEQVR